MHHEVLTKRAAELFRSLSRFPGFYLAGGTALALQIDHRVSVDFDLFSDNEIEYSLLPRVQRVFSDAASIAPLINNSDELTVLVDDVKITFFKYQFPTFDAFIIYVTWRFFRCAKLPRPRRTRSAVAAAIGMIAAY